MHQHGGSPARQGGEARGHGVLAARAALRGQAGEAEGLPGQKIFQGLLGLGEFLGREDRHQSGQLGQAREGGEGAPEERRALVFEELLAHGNPGGSQAGAAASGKDDGPERHARTMRQRAAAVKRRAARREKGAARRKSSAGPP